MSENIKIKIDRIREDYSNNCGHPFKYFYCPILFKDEDTRLCIAHIINTAFPNSARAWTVQREDVDNFFGSKFESDFTNLKHSKKYSADEVLCDPSLSKVLKPEILIDGKPVDYYYPRNNVPNQHSNVTIEKNGNATEIALKMQPEDVLAKINGDWHIDISKDLRLSALVSLIKSAHLTLFEILGYRYALSAGGSFVGKQILGDFYELNKSKGKSEVLKNALSYFHDFEHMVRPLKSNNLGFQGTISDKQLLTCQDHNNNTWALIVFIRINKDLHAVLIPIFDNIDSIPKFLEFLKNDKELIEVNYCRFKNESWEISNKTIELSWPKNGILYPELDI